MPDSDVKSLTAVPVVLVRSSAIAHETLELGQFTVAGTHGAVAYTISMVVFGEAVQTKSYNVVTNSDGATPFQKLIPNNSTGGSSDGDFDIEFQTYGFGQVHAFRLHRIAGSKAATIYVEITAHVSAVVFEEMTGTDTSTDVAVPFGSANSNDFAGSMSVAASISPVLAVTTADVGTTVLDAALYGILVLTMDHDQSVLIMNQRQGQTVRVIVITNNHTFTITSSTCVILWPGGTPPTLPNDGTVSQLDVLQHSDSLALGSVVSLSNA